MLHELILSLTGHCGGVFRETGGGIQVVPDLPFIHPSEVEALNELCRLGAFYKSFQNFIQEHGAGISTKHSDGQLQGLYIRSFCRGLDLVLTDYRNALLSLEQEILRDPHLPVSHLQYCLRDFQLLFPALSTVLDQIIAHRAHGCYLLEVLHKNSISGLPIVKTSLQRILHVCNGVLYKQLCAWMIHGLSHDTHREFFIQHVSGGVPGASTTKSLHSQEDDGDLGIMGVTGRQMQAAKNQTLFESDILQDAGMFIIQADLLPGYIPMRVASKILFVGESVQMFETNKQSRQHTGQFMKEREVEFTKDIQELAKQPNFFTSSFEALVDKIRLHVAEHLWVMVVQEADLRGQLRVMKDFFLLGRGELYLAFIDQTQHLLKGPPQSSTEHDVNTAFQQAARNVLIENDALLQRFKLTITTHTDLSKQASKAVDKSFDSSVGSTPVETGWSCLGLTCTVQWPLHIFFTPSIIKKYDRVFRFLLAVRRTQQDLQATWALQKQGKLAGLQIRTKGQGGGAIGVWQLRHHMTFLVDNLQYYLQVDVIESQFNTLLDTINTTRDFEAIKLAHEHFLAALLAQSFVHMKPVASCLNEILDLCSSFCRILIAQLSTSFLVDRDPARLGAVTKNFQLQSNILFQILSSVSSRNASPHLTQLLLRLDFNKYYTTSGGQLGSA